MTEAAHQIASNPLPPAQRKPGSVGRAAGPQVAIMDAQGQHLPAGQLGEIVIRGPNVTSGYANSTTAHQEAFVDGWLRTGDQGILDEEGYLFINGRIKEIINRGGEKIVPREVDEVILEHPAVAQAITFAVPDARLGEAVAVAIVLQPNAELTPRALRQFAAARLADFKVPQQVIVLEELPKGPTGKPQRIGLAKVLGVTGEEPASRPALDRPPATPLECAIAEVWAAVLQVALANIGAHTSFLQIGGDSVLATQVVLRVQDMFGIELPLIEFFEEPTVAGLALLVTQHQLQQLDPADAASLLAEVANLSEDEIHRL